MSFSPCLLGKSGNLNQAGHLSKAGGLPGSASCSPADSAENSAVDSFSFPRIFAFWRGAALSACLLLLGACGPQGQPMVPGQTEGEAAIRWQAFEKISARPAAPFVQGGSLRFGPPSDTRRVTYLLWGNGDGPLRLDIQAGVGATAAKARVENDALLLYLPQDAKAYIGTDQPDKALSRIGLPLPLGVASFAAFLEGRYADALGQPKALSYKPASKGDGIVYTIETPQGKSDLELSPQGLPTVWKLPHSWNVAIDYDDNLLPRKVEGVITGNAGVRTDLAGYRMILLIKSRQSPAPFPTNELDLDLPQSTPVFSLDD